MRRIRIVTAGVLCAGLLAACGGGSTSATIGGNIAGLATGASVVLQNNGADTLTLSANGTFVFATALPPSSAYAVTVLTQPSGQVCAVGNGSGTVDSNGDDVTTANVTCMSVATVGGTLAGLLPGTAVTLSNGSVLLPLAVNGTFAFPGLMVAGMPYAVTVATQPLGQTCTVTNGVGTVTAGTPIAVAVTCSPS